MEELSLDQKINLRISQHIQYENIVNSCVEKFHSDRNIDATYKKDFFNMCIQNKVIVYNHINDNLAQ